MKGNKIDIRSKHLDQLRKFVLKQWPQTTVLL